MTASATHEAVTQVWKRESARLVAVLTRVVRDVGRAEELAHDALVAALEEWPRAGVPERPGAWLMATARNRALNELRRERMRAVKHEAIRVETHDPGAFADVEAALEAIMDDDVGDEVLRLMFTACHPLLSKEARVALTLRLVGGLSTDEIARAFLVAEPTVAQRIVRAKRTLADARVPFELPRADALGPRLASLLEVVYLVFNEGHTATAGDALARPDLSGEALRLGRLLAGLAPSEPEVWSLLALMQLHASRAPARVDAAGEPVLLMDQDRSRWDAALIASGLDGLARAEALVAASREAPGPYQLQAAIAACHARASVADATDWARIAALYGELARVAPSPIVALNRAVAVSRAEGPAAGLALLDALASAPALVRYHLLPAARAELLERLGRRAEARAEFARAASLTQNARQQERLRARAAALAER
ncbi:MAG: sigma-70 family RNA polymerase sigma factor [Myxococcota bacterium]